MVSVSGSITTTSLTSQIPGSEANVGAPADAAASAPSNAGLQASKSQDASGVGGTQSTVLPNNDSDALDVDAQIRKIIQLALKSGKDALEDANGAPGLAPPSSSDDLHVGAMSEEDMMSQLQLLRTSIMQKQASGTEVTLNRAMNDNISANKERTTKLLDQMAKAYKAMHPHHSFWSWIVKIVSVVVAVVAVVAAAVSAVASGGVASPLLAIAVIGLAAATTSLASQIADKPFSLGSLVSEGFGKLLHGFGVKGDLADNIAKIIGGSLGVASVVGVLGDPSFASELVQGAMTLAHVSPDKIAIVSAVVTMVCVIVAAALVANGSGGSSAARGGSEFFSASTTQLLGNIAKVAKVGGAVVNATGSVIDGVQGVQNAKEARAASEADADLQEVTAQTLQSQAALDKLMEQLKKVMKLVQESMVQVAEGISLKAESRDAISRNMGSIGA